MLGGTTTTTYEYNAGVGACTLVGGGAGTVTTDFNMIV